MAFEVVKEIHVAAAGDLLRATAFGVVEVGGGGADTRGWLSHPPLTGTRP